MVSIGNLPILVHIMRHYYFHGFKEFVILLGNKGNKEYFMNYPFNANDFVLKQKSNKKTLINSLSEDWTISFVDTGQETMTGGRIKRAQEIIGENDFMLTYGDGVSDIDLGKLEEFHKNHNKIATMTSIQPKERFGVFESNEGTVTSFQKNQMKLKLGSMEDSLFLKKNYFLC